MKPLAPSAWLAPTARRFLQGSVFAAALTFALPAHAEEPAGGQQDLQEQIRAQMEKVRDLMRRNEEALLKLSMGKQGEPKRVDVTLPPAPPGAEGAGQQGGAGGASGAEGASGSSAGGTGGASTVEALEQLLRDQASSGEGIPSEIKQLVKMIPL